MPFNLINDAWIPVRTQDGGARLIRPDQIAEPDLVALDWPRADLNVACLELLIGLVYLADPPPGPEDWEERRPDQQRLRERMAPLAPAFNLDGDGDGPRFLQDLEPLNGEQSPPDVLFMDSAGEKTSEDNADLMVRRDRYPSLAPALAAIALYTLQTYASGGGVGYRTSVRGAGPLVTLVDPHGSLWDLIWANVPDGTPQGPELLPWMRPTQTSTNKEQTFQPCRSPVPAEAFFGMPRRIRLTFNSDLVIGVVQQNYGTNYTDWEHPLTPHKREKAGAVLRPQHVRPGVFGYHDWLGVVAAAVGNDLMQRAACVTAYADRAPAKVRIGAKASLIVAGWSMKNAKARDFVLSRQPLVFLDADRALLLRGLIEAAQALSLALRAALKRACADRLKTSKFEKLVKFEALREQFFLQTQADFEVRFAQLQAGAEKDAIGRGWLKDMRRVALGIFDAEVMNSLDRLPIDKAGAVISARLNLLGAFNGRDKGRAAFAALGLEPINKETAT